MGLISRIASFLGQTDRAAMTDIAVTFAYRLAADLDRDGPALTTREKAAYDRVLDGLNRLPRPLMAFGTLSLLAAAMVAPLWFADRMEALAAMPEALWWLIGAVISLYFGSRLQSHEQAFQREMVESIVRLPDPTPPTQPVTPRVAETGLDAALALKVVAPSDNPALTNWLRTRANPTAQT